MKYYSKSPNKIREDIERKDELRFGKKRQLGRIILFMNFVLVIAVILIYSLVVQKERPVTKSVIHPQEFLFQGYKIQTDCKKLTTCQVLLQNIEKINTIASFSIIVIDTKSNTTLFEQEQECNSNEKFVIDLPKKLNPDLSAYLNIKTKNGKSKFKIY